MSGKDPRNLLMADYTYALPDERIARHPLTKRDASKLLLYKDGVISEDTFQALHEHLPAGSLLVVNTTKVVHARLQFRKPTGGLIELFCLEPHPQYPDITTAMGQHGRALWQCLVGGAAKWKPGVLLQLEQDGLFVTASLLRRNTTDFTIEFNWTPEHLSFAEVLKLVGKVPLPPYLNREADAKDEDSYQTLFAQEEGSVAAPTASLHFTPEVMQALEAKGIQKGTVTLHVGAGTFKPVKSDTPLGHDMHAEWIDVSKTTIEALLQNMQRPVVAAGTTAMRTLESLYWIGRKILESTEPISMEALAVAQWEAYDERASISTIEALNALLNWMELSGKDRLITKTSILIGPGYTFRVVNALITNFHQPGSTLLLLVAAFIGDDWHRVYDYALQHGFRFLSYGDGSLLWRAGTN
jgi:S-adenosylmethionine:tRNA ribosyltransferase-isomerase